MRDGGELRPEAGGRGAEDREGTVDAPRIFTPEYYRRMDELEARSWWNAGMRDVAGLLLDEVDLPERGSVVDVGCGTGRTLAWFRRRRPRWTTVGADLSAEALGVACERAEDTPGLARADALALPIRSGFADLVVSFDVLQHLPLEGGDAMALAEIARVLKPGGHLLLRTNAQAFPRREDDPEHDFHRYETRELRRRLAEAGLRPLRLSRVNALLGLAEIPRELRSRFGAGEAGYQGILADAARAPSPLDRWKRAWLRLEGRLVAAGRRLPLGRSIVALARRET